MSDKIALVTGGTGGLGTAICQALAQQHYRVVANYHPNFESQAQDWQLSQRQAGFEFELIAGDVGQLEDCERMVQSLEQSHGRLDALVNNAGITRDATLRKMQAEQWDAVINTNLNSMFYMCKQVAPNMISRNFGRIVNISSVNGQKGQYGQTNYSAAKAGVHGFTMALAQETARYGVTVNSISPGYIATEMVMSIAEPIRQQIIDEIPVGRLGTPEEIGRAVAFLADENAGFITGTNLSINGGLFMH